MTIAVVAFADGIPKGTSKRELPQPSRVGVVAQQVKEAQQKQALEEQKAATNVKG